ncbi:3-keto-disaccharide hydrolase [Coraliomargarita akajimensis]|nr:DUF1080 domain-containing protein [Coraliomargarita akajimensis]
MRLIPQALVVSGTVLSLFSGCAHFSNKAQSKATESVEYTALFNGEDLSGWNPVLRVPTDPRADEVFQVEDGAIHVFKNFPQDYGVTERRNATHGMLFTEQSFSRFILRFEYKWGDILLNNYATYQYDAGVYYHISGQGVWPHGLEYQVRYDHVEDRNHTGDFWASSVQIDWTSADGEHFAHPADGGQIVPRKRGEHRALKGASVHKLDGEWNRCEVIVMGSDYAIHKLNGQVVNVGTNLTAGEGVIGLQAETAEIFYRNIEILELPESLPIDHFLAAE